MISFLELQDKIEKQVFEATAAQPPWALPVETGSRFNRFMGGVGNVVGKTVAGAQSGFRNMADKYAQATQGQPSLWKQLWQGNIPDDPAREPTPEPTPELTPQPTPEQGSFDINALEGQPMPTDIEAAKQEVKVLQRRINALYRAHNGLRQLAKKQRAGSGSSMIPQRTSLPTQRASLQVPA